jgi:hypothetical protein
VTVGVQPAEAADGNGPPAVALRLPGGERFEGPTIDLRGVDAGVPDGSIADAIRAGCPTRPDRPAVHAPAPTAVHPHVARLDPDADPDREAALAAVGAARGIRTEHDADLAAVRESFRSLSPPPVDESALRAARRRAAEAGSETERLRERVATLRGRVTALREDGDDDAVADAEASLSAAARDLSEAATERVAARQRLSALEDRAQEARDVRERRLRLADRVGNLERAVRSARVDAVTPEFRDARRRIGRLLDGSFGEGDRTRSGLRDALAVAAIAPLRAPVVVAGAVVSALGGRTVVEAQLGGPLVLR